MKTVERLARNIDNFKKELMKKAIDRNVVNDVNADDFKLFRLSLFIVDDAIQMTKEYDEKLSAANEKLDRLLAQQAKES